MRFSFNYVIVWSSSVFSCDFYRRSCCHFCCVEILNAWLPIEESKNMNVILKLGMWRYIQIHTYTNENEFFSLCERIYLLSFTDVLWTLINRKRSFHVDKYESLFISFFVSTQCLFAQYKYNELTMKPRCIEYSPWKQVKMQGVVHY